jgi:hypothetical protein
VPAGDQLTRRLSPLIRTWFGFARAENGDHARAVHLATWFARRQRREPDDSRARCGEGSRARWKPCGSSSCSGPSAAADGLPTRATFDVPAGRAIVQATVQNEEGQALDVDLRDLTVPAFEDGVESFGTVQVFRAPNAAEFEALSSGVTASPIVTREFSTSDRLLIRVPVYGLPESGGIEGSLYASNGVLLRDVPFVRGPERALWQADVPLNGLANGSYYIEFTGTGRERAKRERVIIGVRR